MGRVYYLLECLHRSATTHMYHRFMPQFGPMWHQIGEFGTLKICLSTFGSKYFRKSDMNIFLLFDGNLVQFSPRSAILNVISIGGVTT